MISRRLAMRVSDGSLDDDLWAAVRAGEREMTLGTQIRKERKRLGITGREMARQLGISASYLCDIELDRRFPPLATLKRIGKIIDIEYGCGHGPCRRCGKAWPK